MIVVLDASVLVYLFHENARAPIDTSTGLPVAGGKERIEHLLATLSHDRAKIVIPTPSLAEVLVKAGTAAPDWLRILSNSKHFRIVPFDVRAAVEFAAAQALRRPTSGHAPGGRQKAKFDDQIVAIAVVEGANTIYSDDEGISRLVGQRLAVKGIADLPLPAADKQLHLRLDSEPEAPAPDPSDDRDD